jgi:alpha-tubulin suppressor-like RCC1 family protein
LHCWGANNGQQLGVVGDEDRLTPQSLTGSWETVALGASSTCAVDTDGSLWCWGANDDGQLGVGDVLPRASPERVGDGQGWVGAALAVGFGCAFDVDGALFCMGEARRLGREEASLVPVPIATGGPVEDAVAGKNHGCVLRRDGVAVCWGENDDGEVATGDRLERAVPSEVCQP